MEDLLFKPASDQVALLRSGELSARELLAAHLNRIDEVNGDINAIVTLVPEMAEAAAQAADERHARGEVAGVLDGLPVAHKDSVDTAGIRTTSGSPIYVERVPDENALIVDRLQQAGAVSIGKTNIPEFGAGSQTFNPVFGATRNPYDLSKTVGGSSGGAAAALVSGMVPIADGSDVGGSLRNPASFCNVVGLRPPPGRVPTHPSLTPWSTLLVSGPMARTVGDIALLLQAIAGPDPRSPISLQDPPTLFAAPLEVDLGELKVAWAPTVGGLPIAESVSVALEGVPGVFESLGWLVAEDVPDLMDAPEVFQVLRACEVEVGLGELYDSHHDHLKDTIRWNIEEARRRSLADYAGALRKRAALFHRVREFYEIYDVLACPTVQVAPFDVTLDWVREINGIPLETYIDWMRSCSDVTVMGCPAISVPAGFTPDGLPVGLQLVGKPGDDLGLLRIAKAYESATEVWKRRPEPVE